MAVFPSTRWSLINASDLSSGRIADAWNELFQAYQPAIVGYFRRHSIDCDPDDLAQEFFLRSMSESWWSRADPQIGSFRQFLIVLLKRFCARDRQSGYPRQEMFQNSINEPAHSETPDRQFDIDFAACVIREAIRRLRAEFERDNRISLFDALLPFIAERVEHGEIDLLSRQLNIAPNTLSVQLKRLRVRLQKTIRGVFLQLSVDGSHAQADLVALREVLAEHTHE